MEEALLKAPHDAGRDSDDVPLSEVDAVNFGKPTIPRSIDLKPISKRFRKPWSRIATLAIVFVGSCFASGPVTSWPTFEPLLGKYHVLGSTVNMTSPALSEVYVLGQGMLSVLGLPMGVVYDTIGPDKTAALGGTLSVIGLVSMAFCITRPEYNWWLYWAYPVTVGGGGFCSYSVLGFMWLMPKHQTLIGSLLGASYSVSDAFALVGVGLIAGSVLTLPQFFYWLGAVGGLSGLLCWALSPNFHENKIFFLVANKDLLSANQSKQTDDSKSGCLNNCRNLLDLVKKSRHVFWLHPAIISLVQVQLCIFYLAAMYPSLDMYDYFVTILGTENATGLVDTLPVVYGSFGTIFTLFSGWLCDRIGLVHYMHAVVWLQVGVAVCVMIPAYYAQLVWLVSWSILQQSFIVIYMRFAARYAPFELFGTFMGCMSTFMALPQMIFGTSIQNLFKALYPDNTDPRRYTVIFLILNVLTVLSLLSLLYHWRFNPPPAAGSVVITTDKDGAFRVECAESKGVKVAAAR